ncbi:MAG: hypothetical protein M3076_09855 [Actinomycetota bacterium]|nr:hypothetical protein [Actinomycetota bacterium]
MRRLLTFAAVMSVLATVGVLAGAGGASAVSVSAPVADCSVHGKLTHHYATAELQQALSTMPSDIQVYTDCVQVIQDQLLAQLGKNKANGGSGAGSGGSFLPAPVIIAIVVLALAAVALGGLALVRRRPRAP